MVVRMVKYGVIGTAGALVLGGLVFGSDVVSYARTGVLSAQASVRDNVPIEFELRRAADLLDEIIPEMHANLRLVAQEEVELEQLRQDIATSEEQLSAERVRVAKLRDMLDVQQASYRVSDRTYTREQVREDLSRRFERIKEAEVVLAGKQRLLGTREQALEAAVTVLQRTRSQKSLLEDRIEGLQAQHRLVQAAQVGSRVQVDGSKLAQTEKLISDIKKRLDVAERVLAREGDFVQGINVDVVDEGDLLADVDAYLKGEPKQTDQAQLPATDAKPQPSAYRDLAEHGVQLN
jgi:hypothetical protein